MHKFVRRHKSISGKVGSGGIVAAGSLLTKAGRLERKEREKEKERERERERERVQGVESEREDHLITSIRRKGIQKEKGKGKELDGITAAERNSMMLAHALNTYAFASASLTPEKSAVSLAPSTQSRRSSRSHFQPTPGTIVAAAAHTRPLSQTISPAGAQTLAHVVLQPPSTPSRDSHSSVSTSSSSGPSTPAHKPKTNDLNFSTLDRTILQELKLSLTARESQFVLKGPGSGMGPRGTGVKHHPYSSKEVPYPRSYDRGVVDL